MPRYFLPLLILSLVACCIEVDISVPGFPDMGRYFQVEDGIIQMTIAYNFLGFCLGAALYGPLSDAYGRRSLMVWGNAILLIGAVGCVIAPSLPFLLWTRFIQGIGASASAVVVFAMIADAYPAKDTAARLIGAMNAVFSTLMAGAPIVGGLINQGVGWRGNYAMVALICIVSWICLVFFLPETKSFFEPFRFRKIKEAYGKLLTNADFMCASLIPSLSYAAYLAFIAQASFLYTETFNLSLIAYVLHQCVIIFVFSIVSLFSGSLIQKMGARACIIKGVSFSGGGGILLVLASLIAPASPYLATLFMSLIGLGFAISYPVIFAASLEMFPDIRGTASSLIMSVRSFLCFGFVAVSGYLYDGRPIRISLIVLTAIAFCLFFTVKLLRSPWFCHSSSPQGAS